MPSSNSANDNQNALGHRLRHEMKKRGISSVELARRADVKTSFLYDVMSGKSANPSSIKLARVAESLGISLTYLAGTSDSPQSGYQFTLPPEQDYLSIPRLYIQHGEVQNMVDALENMQFRKDWLRKNLHAAPEHLRLFTVDGDVMAPTLHAGDLVLVDIRRQHPSPPGVFLLFDGVGLVAKRLELIAHPQQPRLRLLCDNPQYSSYECTLDDIRILGRVVWFAREI